MKRTNALFSDLCFPFPEFQVGRVALDGTNYYIFIIALFSIAKNRSWRLTAKHRGIELRTNKASLTSFKYTLASVLCRLYFLCFRKCSSGKQQNVVVGVIAIPTHAILIDSQREPFLFVFLSLESLRDNMTEWEKNQAKLKTEKAKRWQFLCGRKDFQKLEQIKKDTYICSLHFIGVPSNPLPVKFFRFTILLCVWDITIFLSLF